MGATSRPTYLTLRAANVARQREWDRDARITGLYRSNELCGEVGEAANVVKKLERERLGIAGSRATVPQLAAELADVIICVDLVALHYGIDMNAAVVAKFNATSSANGLATRLANSDLLHPSDQVARLEGDINDYLQERDAAEARADGLYRAINYVLVGRGDIEWLRRWSWNDETTVADLDAYDAAHRAAFERRG